MRDSKEKILQTALRLFAEQGYEAVSVSDNTLSVPFPLPPSPPAS